jgi:hypothetical protein
VEGNRLTQHKIETWLIAWNSSGDAFVYKVTFK